MADDIEERVEQELIERFPPPPEAELYGVRFTGDPYPYEIHLQGDGGLAWTHRGGALGSTTTLHAAVASEMTTAIRALLDREQWLINRLVEREREIEDLKRTHG